MKTCGASFVNTILHGTPIMPECFYNPEFESSYEDEYWYFVVGELIAKDATWYGYE